MKFKVILSISRRHLITRKKQTIVAALGVTFGIGAYVIMMSFMTGLNGLLDGLILNRTPHIHLYNEVEPSEMQPLNFRDEFKNHVKIIHSIKPRENKIRIHNALPIISYLKDQPNVKGVTAGVRAQGFYMAGTTRMNGSFSGIDVVDENLYYNLGDYIVKGNALDLATNDNTILLGIGVAKKLGLDVGDYIRIATVTGEIQPLKIVGFYQSGISEIDNFQSYVNIKMAQRLMGESNNYITDINVKLHDLNLAPEIAKDLAGKYDLTATDIQTANAQFETGTQVRNIISYAVSITLLIVAGFGIYNILNMLIYEKMNDIAILKATGFSGKDVQLIFMSQALIIGLIGGAIGLFLGFWGSFFIDQIPFGSDALPTIKTMPVNYDPAFYVIGIVFAMISTFFAGYFPSRKAQRIDPVEIIRGQ